ncbi:MAG: carboxypeptidase regulatory-like domain-containing protein, partial [Acidobacteria bacterium]|nr:carboxypeptidase regulatory-like domain-containing protein [Acidobacteriota bacterium]
MTFSKVSLVVCLFFLSTSAAAQDSSAVLRGSVLERSGVPVPGATIEAVNLGTRQSHITTSNPEGTFELRSLMSAEYEVRVSHSGFVTQTRRGLQLSGGQLASVSFTLEPSSVSRQQNTRQDGAGAPAGGAVSNRISAEQLAGLPLNGRSYNQLAALQAGVSDPSAASGSRGLGRGGLNIMGGRSTSNNYMVDGINIQDIKNSSRSAARVQLGSDAVLQVRVFSANSSAEYGRSSGGALNSITRSGSNEFHGTLFDYFRNSKLDARNFFDQGPEPPPFKRNQFGAMVSGPMRKDKTFFLLSFEAMRDRLTETQISRYPDEKARQGLLPDPNNLDANCFLPLSDRPDDCFTDVGLHPEVKPYLEFLYPEPNSVQLRAGIREHATEVYQPTDDTFATLRVDHSISERDGVFVRYSFDDATSFSPQFSSVFRQRATSRQQYLTLAESHIFSLNTVNSFRFGYTRPTGITESVSSIEIPRSLFFFPAAPKFGQLIVAGLSNLGNPPPHPETSINNSFQFTNDLILQKGSHTTKFGVQIHRYRWYRDTSVDAGGEWAFNSLESFLRGGPEGTTVQVQLPGGEKLRDYRQTLFGFYVQDTYNARPGLQFNMGLRYEFATLLREANGRSSHLADLLHDTEVTVGPILARNPSLRAFSPRLSITWSPDTNTVFSAGFGIYYDQALKSAIFRHDSARPFFTRAVRTNFDASSFFPDPLSATVGLPGEVRGLDFQNTTIPTVLRYNFGIQRSVPGGWRLRATYVGARGNHLYRSYEANLYPIPIVRADGKLFFPDDCDAPEPSDFCQPGASKGLNPAFSSGILLNNSDAQSFYNALQLSANKSLSGGLSLQASYTFSKSVDDASDTFENAQYPYLRTLNRGPSNFDIRQRLVLNYFYSLPFGSGRSWATSGILSKMFGGWRLGGIFSVRTGTPFTATVKVRNPGFLFAANRPNLIAGQ